MASLTTTRDFVRLVAAALLAAGLLGGCASTDHVAPPAPLQPVDNQFAVDSLWSVSAGAAQPSRLSRLAPEVVGERVYSVDPRGRILAHDLGSGRQVFEARLGTEVLAGVAASEELIVVGTADARALAVSPENGDVLWEAALSSAAAAPAAIGEGRVVVRAGDGRVFVLDAADGRRLWVDGRAVPPLSLQGQSRPLIVSDAVVIGHDSGLLAVHTLADGQVIWENQVALGRGRTDIDRMVDIDATPLFSDGVVYALAFQGNLAAIDARSGQTIWSREMSGFDDFVADRRALYLTDAEGVIHAVDRHRGDTLWRQDELNNRFLTGPVLYRGTLVVGDFEGYLHFLDPETGQIIARHRVAGRELVSPLRTAGDALIVLGRNGRLTAVRIP